MKFRAKTNSNPESSNVPELEEASNNGIESNDAKVIL